jgi:hypothetical protein
VWPNGSRQPTFDFKLINDTTIIVRDSLGCLEDYFRIETIGCPENITINATISTSNIYQASQSIKGTNTNIITPSATVEYRARYIELAPNSSGSAAFIATPSNGSYFLAVPVGCNTANGSSAQRIKDTIEGVFPSKTTTIKHTNELN